MACRAGSSCSTRHSASVSASSVGGNGGPMDYKSAADFLALAARGYTNKAISAQLFISDRTVQGHLAHIYAKLQANTRTEAVMRAVSLGLIAP